MERWKGGRFLAWLREGEVRRGSRGISGEHRGQRLFMPPEENWATSERPGFLGLSGEALREALRASMTLVCGLILRQIF